MRDNFYWGTHGSDRLHVRMHTPHASALTCDHCRRELSLDRMLVAIAPDSSSVRRDEPGHDGSRLVRTEPLAELIDEARAGRLERWVTQRFDRWRNRHHHG
jgi:hypothetical protein